MNSSTSNTRIKVIFAALASLAAIAPIASRAAETSVTVSRQVSYAGVNLNTPEGARAAYVRLKSAARSLCSTSDPLYRAPSWIYSGCVQDALARAIRHTNRPLITQVFVSDYGIEAAEEFGIKLAAK
jgi:UrcA family protein